MLSFNVVASLLNAKRDGKESAVVTAAGWSWPAATGAAPEAGTRPQHFSVTVLLTAAGRQEYFLKNKEIVVWNSAVQESGLLCGRLKGSFGVAEGL